MSKDQSSINQSSINQSSLDQSSFPLFSSKESTVMADAVVDCLLGEVDCMFLDYSVYTSALCYYMILLLYYMILCVTIELPFITLYSCYAYYFTLFITLLTIIQRTHLHPPTHTRH